MVMMNSIAYIFWDPVREMFTMPLLGRPVMWYGFFFVFGFILGYFIGIPIFKKVLGKTKALLERDIANWPQLLRLLRRASQQDVGIPTQIVNAFDPNVVHKLQELTACEQLKKNVLKELNRVAETMQISRDELIKQFPKAFNSLQDLSMYLTDRLMWFVMSGAIIGARLGHVLFYEWPYFSSHPAEIVKIWNGGLASHGGTIGILLALLFYWRYVRTSFPELSLVRIMDILSIPTALAAYFIRVGNFVNQEIIGTETALPWGVLFAHPANGAPPVPRHPAQLYEGIAYLLTFALLMIIWRRKGADIKPGVISGLFFVCVFGSRFLVEFVKMPLSSMVNETYIQTGQVLSIPFILLGCWLIAKGKGPAVAQTLHQE